MKRSNIGAAALPLAGITALVLSCGVGTLDSKETTPGDESAQEAREEWAIDGTSSSETDNTHLWIVNTALRMIRSNGKTQSGTKARELLDALLDPSSTCAINMRQGLYDADYDPAYNDGVDTGEPACIMLLEAWWNDGWSSHFYDPDTGLNYAHKSSPTARTEASRHYATSMRYPELADSCYELGLALHYLTDVTQPMHASNFTNKDSPMILHENFETFANVISRSTPEPPWVDITGEPTDILQKAAIAAKPRLQAIKDFTAPCAWFDLHPPSGGCNAPWPATYDNGAGCWDFYGGFTPLANHTRTTLSIAAQHTASYALKWLNATEQYDHRVSLQMSPSGTWAAGCNDGEVIVGFYGDADNNQIGHLGFWCAAQDVEGRFRAPHAVDVGWQPISGNRVWGSQCPAGQVVSSLRLGQPNSGQNFNGFGFTCSNPSAPLETWQAPYVGGTGNGTSNLSCAPMEGFKSLAAHGTFGGTSYPFSGVCGKPPPSATPTARESALGSVDPTPYIGRSFIIVNTAHDKQLGVTSSGNVNLSTSRLGLETWTIHNASDGLVFLVNDLGQALSSNESRVVSMSPNRAGFERWRLETVGSNVVLRSDTFGTHLGARPDGTFYTTLNYGPWEGWRLDPAATNLALRKPTSQSSTYSYAGGPPLGSANAVDGNIDGELSHGSVTRTTNINYQPWWQVDLERVQPIDTVVLWNRTDDCCSRDLADFRVLVSDDGWNWQSYAYAGTAGRSVSFGIQREARYVKVQLDGQSFLQLAEVQVFAPRNLALGKPTSQSSTYGGSSIDASASKAVDGNTDGVFEHSSVTHTNNEVRPWWQVDLRRPEPIGKVVLWNRTDCCSDRLSNFNLLVSDDGAIWQSFPHPGTAGERTELDVQRTARYVKVQLEGTNFLSLAEVQVFAATNLALGRPTTQSSVYTQEPETAPASDSAVDGNTDGTFRHYSVTHTQNDPQAWWQVDLLSSQPIGRVVLWNRTNCCSERLGNFNLLVSDDAVNWQSYPYAGTVTDKLTIDVGRRGRYVKVQLNGTNFLSLAEVQVFPPRNLALLKPTAQSSTYTQEPWAPGPASAVDGNTDGVFSHSSVTHTNIETQPWWQVDLQTVERVSSVVIWNRTDCCSDRLRNFDLILSDDGINWRWYGYDGIAPAKLTMPINGTARWVKVRLRDGNFLSLAEVQVFGY